MGWATIGGAVGSIWGPVGSAVGSVAGGLLDREQAKDDAEQKNAWSAEAQAKQFEFSERMSNTSYQRGVKDMQAAGLNPMLAYSQGGASTPTGSSYEGAETRPIGGYDASSANVASQYERNMAEAGRARQETRASEELTPVNVREKLQAIEESKTRQDRMLQEIEQSKGNVALMAAQREKVIAEIPVFAAQIEQLRSVVKLNDAQIAELRSRMGLQRAQVMDISEQSANRREEFRVLRQRIEANLPALEADLRRLEAAKERRDVPRQSQEESLHADPILGAAASMIKMISPLLGGVLFNLRPRGATNINTTVKVPK